MFINPFACNVDPFLWRELQEAVASASDPEEALQGAGVSCSASAVYYVTPSQHEALVVELEAMEASMNVELCAWLIADCLSRAQTANAKYGG